jgi:uncharacterized membrane protein
MIYLSALLIGVVAGMRSMTAPAATSWAARLGWIHVDGTPLAWMGAAVTPWIFTVLAVLEIIGDKLPKTPSRKAAGPFGARIVSGALCGAAVGAGAGMLAVGLILGVLGAVIGTLGGYAFRARLARAFGRDLPAALLEDVTALALAWLVFVGR